MLTGESIAIHNSGETEWYAVQVASHCESVVQNALVCKGHEAFFPTYLSVRHWSDRVKKQTVPLFPGYVFCRMDLNNRLPVLSTPGVVQIVSRGKHPVAIPDQEIDSLKSVLRSNLPFAQCQLEPGQRVVVERGPLAGVQGVLLEARGEQRLLVSITLLRRSIVLDIDASCVRLITDVPEFSKCQS